MTVLRNGLFLLLFFLLSAIPSVTQQAFAQAGSEQPSGTMDAGEFLSQLRLAHVYEDSRDYTNAVRVYEALHQSQPDNLEVFQGLAQSYYFLRRYADLEKITLDRLAKNPNDADVLILLGRTEAKLAKRSDALDAFRKAADASAANGPKCIGVINVANAMIDVAMNDDAIKMLRAIDMNGEDASGICGPQLAGLYLRLGQYAEAAKQYLAMLDKNETSLGYVEQRFSQFTADSVARLAILGALRTQLESMQPTVSSLQLLAWMYGEQKDYENALKVITQLDDLSAQQKGLNRGYELLLFAERATSEGALSVAVKAYNLATERMRSNPGAKQGDYYLAQAELGGLRTNEKYLESKPGTTTAEWQDLLSKYEAYGSHQPYLEFSLEALLRAGDIAYEQAFDLQHARSDYELVLNKAKGFNDRVRDAAFGLVDVAIASNDLTLAKQRLDAIGDMLKKKQARPSDAEIMRHVLYDQALIDYYEGSADSAAAKLATLLDAPESDFANDAIQLNSIISENNKLSYVGALHTYAKAQLAETRRDYATALSTYKTIVESEGNAPLADDAAMRSAEMQLKLGKPEDAIHTLDVMQEKMPNSPMLDQAAFRAAEITEQILHDKAKAQHLYEEFLERYPKSTLGTDARDRARRLRGDVF